MIVHTGLEDGFESAKPTLQQIEARCRIIQEESHKEHSIRVLFVFVYHEQVIAMIEVGLTRTLVVETASAEMIDYALRHAGQLPSLVTHAPA